MTRKPLDALRYHVSGAIERGEKTAIIEKQATRYSHVFEIAFRVESGTEDGSDITPAMLKAALLERINNIEAAEWMEACGAPFDTYEVPPDA